MDRQEWIGKKIALLKKQGKSNQESLIIALASWENMPKAQGGGAVTDMYGNISYPNYKPMQDGNNNNGVDIDLSDNNNGMLRPDLMPSQQQLYSNQYYNTLNNNYTVGEDQEGNAINTGERKIVDNRESQMFNPYGGMDLEGSLFYAGQGFASKNYGQAAMGTGLSLLKGARNFLTGFSSAKASKEAYDSAKEAQFRKNTNPSYQQEGGQMPPSQEGQDQMQQIMQMIMQSLQQGMSPEQVMQQLVQAGVSQEQAQMLLQEVMAQSQAPQEQGQMMQEGGTATNADMMTGAYIAEDAPQDANIEIEKGEYVFNSQTGEIKKGEGERHTNGGIKVDLPEGSMILSNYTKIGAKTAKEMSSKFDIKASATDTFSQVMDKINRKIGYFKLLDEEKEQLKKVEKTDKLETNKATQDLNADFLGKQLQEIEQKKSELLKDQQSYFQELFTEQESREKKGNGTEILKKEGGSVYNPAILEMAKEYSLPVSKVSQIMQQGGFSPQNYKKMTYADGTTDYIRPTGGTTNGFNNNQKEIRDIKYNVATRDVKEGSLPANQMYTRVDYVDGTRDYIKKEQEVEETFRRMPNYVNYMRKLGAKNNPPVQPNTGVAFIPNAQPIMQEGGMPMAQQGRRVASSFENPELYKKQDAVTNKFESFGQLLKDKPKETLAEIKRIHPQLYDKYFKDDKVPNYLSIGRFQDDINTKYEAIKADYITQYGADSAQVKELDGQIQNDKFLEQDIQYDEKKDRNTNRQVRGKDSYLGNFTSTRPNFSIEVLPKEDLARVNKAGVNSAWQLEQQFPDLYKKYVGDKGLKSDFYLGQIQETPAPSTPTEETDATPADNTITLEGTKYTMPPLLPQDINLPPSALQNIYLGELRIGEVDPIKISPEAKLREIERQRQSVANNSYFLGDSERAALMASSLGQSQALANEAIGQAEVYNAQSEQQASIQNNQNKAKENIFNLGQRKTYERDNLAGQAMYENNLRSYFNELNNQNRANWLDVEKAKFLGRDNYTTDGSSIAFNSDGTQIQNNRNPTDFMTAQGKKRYEAYEMAKAKAAGTKAGKANA